MTKPGLTGTGEQLLKAQLGHMIATILSRYNISANDAALVTGVAPNTMARLLAGLDRSTSIFRLIEILGRLGYNIDLQLRVGVEVATTLSTSTSVEIETGELRWRLLIDNAALSAPSSK